MAAQNVAVYVQALFKGTEIAVKVESDLAVLAKEYPYLAGLLILSNDSLQALIAHSSCVACC